MSPVKELERAAAKRGVLVVQCSEHHYQLRGGPLMVNYYPHSARRTAYVEGTTKGRTHVSPEAAVAMCFEAPAVVPKVARAKRNNSTANKHWLWNRNRRHCHRCGTWIEKFEDATLEHKIPLARGGLNVRNNMALSCADCNHEAGSSMPELRERERDADREMFGDAADAHEIMGIENIGNK